MRHESKCANPHGHNYVALFHAEADALDSIGRVIDFSVLKDLIGGWIDKNWDHTFLAFEDDEDMIKALQAMPGRNKPIWICSFNPTAENMADFLLRYVCPMVLVGTGVRVNRVTLWETENCFAEVTL